MDPARIGFMQGRFSVIEEGRIQAFPWQTWRDEFAIAKKHGFRLMEWVIEQERLNENPLMSRAGRLEIKELMKKNDMAIRSITCDTYIQEPFYKAQGSRNTSLLDDFKKIVSSCAELGIKKIVVPLVDKGSLENKDQEEELLRGMASVAPVLRDSGAVIVFESDFRPSRLKKFIAKFDPEHFGINYDIGNSASLGYDFKEEFPAYGGRIKNVHIKDRKFKGTTVPLGEGDADIAGALSALRAGGYEGNYILQTARASDGDHAGALCRYRCMVEKWLEDKEAICQQTKNLA
ncbi:MAG: sugar phosphate isomerase/epimerase [Candidatus Omnitrophica bacterium]|nr:sugar phosphate isomerase/epimerase [Candidatus Omnitrophota bacterium]